MRCIDPTPARFKHVNDAADHTPVINARLAARIRGKMRRDLRKLFVRKPKTIRSIATSFRKP